MQALHVSHLRPILFKIRNRLQRYWKRMQDSDRYRWTMIFVVGMFEWICLKFINSVKISGQPSKLERARTKPKKIAFVLPWYGQGIVGGAEAATFDLIQALMRLNTGLQIEVLTSTLKEFSTDWNAPYHPEGVHIEQGITVRRFHATQRNRSLFHFLNGTCLMEGGTEGLKGEGGRASKSPLPFWAEAYYLRNMIQIPGLFKRLRQHSAAYDFCIFVPYMFSPTVIGSLILRKKALVMPCLHDERYAYMQVFQKAFQNIGAMLCLVRSEQELAERLFPQVKHKELIGAVVETELPLGNPQRFQTRFGIKDPFIIYVGRQISGKNLPLLAERFLNFTKSHPQKPLKLVLLGKGDLNYSQFPNIINLGFVTAQEKADALAAALCLCQPSLNESFSLVIMESWLQKRPVLVHSHCEVTRDHAQDSQGGFIFDDQDSFDQSLLKLIESPDKANEMGQKGRDYVLGRFAPEKIAQKFFEAIEQL